LASASSSKGAAVTDPAGSTSVEGATLDPTQTYGYARPPQRQEAFDRAAAQLLSADGWSPAAGSKELVADLALEGGGVKGIAIVGAVSVLAEAGYRFQRVAGTSAGAIAATLIAAISKAGKPMSSLKGYLDGLSFKKFMPEGKLHLFLDHHLGKAGGVLSDAEILSHRMGLYPGDYLAEWLGPILQDDLGVRTFADLKITLAEDPGMSLPESRRYRLVVHTSDITRGELARLPWDYNYYGHDRDTQEVVPAVRASMSIPFFFEPVTFDGLAADVAIPLPGGGSITSHYDPGTVTWVDGGMLRNFPIDAFARMDGAPPRWPTIGIKLSSLQTSFGATKAATTAFHVARSCLGTMMNEWDAYNVDESTAGRTIFVDNAGLTATDFDLTTAQQNTLFLNGVDAATAFVIEMAGRGGVPRTGQESRAFLSAAP
jgi:NTE family protein